MFVKNVETHKNARVGAVMQENMVRARETGTSKAALYGTALWESKEVFRLNSLTTLDAYFLCVMFLQGTK